MTCYFVSPKHYCSQFHRYLSYLKLVVPTTLSSSWWHGCEIWLTHSRSLITCANVWMCLSSPGHRYLHDPRWSHQEDSQWRICLLPLQPCPLVIPGFLYPSPAPTHTNTHTHTHTQTSLRFTISLEVLSLPPNWSCLRLICHLFLSWVLKMAASISQSDRQRGIPIPLVTVSVKLFPN